ncbi:MAG: tyrosine--tRNA ligase [Candidatus Hadarchaeum sp.]|uniref:tyrosine--tRNA ligase n=1 Tax=Candidatus Hadarchaeum sp. TaxID=2883567 RepID=UPI003D0EF9B5
MKPIDIVLRGVAEAVTVGELRQLLAGEKFSAYCGYEPSGKVHFGHALTVSKLIDLQRVGARVTVLLADLHAFLNHKGTLEEIRRIAEYNKHCFIALGLDPKQTNFVLGSSFQLKPEYVLDVLKMATNTTILRARRAMAEIARQIKDPDVAQTIYPLMQSVDIAHLGVDIAVGGIDQRKVHMVAREMLPELGYKKPVCIHVPLLHGLDGEAKMSSSKGNFIAVDDDPAMIKQKVAKAFCPPKIVKDNPVIEYVEYFVLPALGKLSVDRPEKYGGPLEIGDAAELRKIYAAGKLHPADLKTALAESLVKLLAPVREYFDKNPWARLESQNRP